VKPEQAVRWLSEPRFRNFLNAAGGEHDSAVALYVWNADISAALLGVLHHLEVLLRNGIDGQFLASRADQPVSICQPEVWLTDPEILGNQGREKVNEAIGRLTSENRTPTRSRLIASLTFGFWTALFSGHYETLWRTTLVKAFPNGNGRRNQVRKSLARVLHLRNQVAHHEAIFGRNLAKDYRVMLEVAGMIDANARDYIESISRVDSLLRDSFAAFPRTTQNHDDPPVAGRAMRGSYPRTADNHHSV
jgi:hypothetical protein